MGNMYSLLGVDSTCQPIIAISCSTPLILVSSSLSFWQQPARILTRETRLESCTNVSRNKTQFTFPQCMKKPRAEGKIIFFCFKNSASGKNSRSSGCQEEGERGLALTTHLPLLHSNPADPPDPNEARLKLSRMTRFRAATDRHMEKLESLGNGSWNHFLECLFVYFRYGLAKRAFRHFQV